MRLRLLPLVLPLLTLYAYGGVHADPSRNSGGTALYPPGLQPLINRANILLSAGQFSDAIKAYSEAIEQSPLDYLLYYKRATAYFSTSRHSAALADFDQVLSLTSNTFEKAHIMKARIYAKDGAFAEAREALKEYTTKNKNDPTAQEVLISVTEAELAAKKASQAMRAQLWTACEEAASTALQTASHSVGLRQQRADCALASGNIESAAGDLTRLTHLTTPSTTLLMKIFRLTYFLFPYSSSEQSPALSTLKQCLHYDPDSSQCLPAHRLVKSFDKNFKKLDQYLAAEDWYAVVKLLFGGSPSEDGLVKTFDAALEQHVTRTALDLPSFIPVPNAKHTSARREALLRAACQAYFKLGEPKKGEQWCEALLGMQGMDNDAQGLLGRAEALLAKEEWEEAVRVLERAFEASGRANREIHARLQRAQKLLKQSRQKDYYKVLDVPRDADTKAIKKAFRKAAMKAHPDKGGSEAKMAAVNEAYEVLNNPELRQRYDNGDDPNDPTAGQGGHPFHTGPGAQQFARFFQQGFGGSSFQFHHPGRH